MDLSEAFRILQVIDDDAPPEARRRIANATTVVMKALHVLGQKCLRHIPASVGGDAEDIAQIVLLQLVQSGPRADAPGPQQEREVLAYLRVCLTNELRTQIRKANVREKALKEVHEEGRKELERSEQQGAPRGGDGPGAAGAGPEAGHPIDALREALRNTGVVVAERVIPRACESFRKASARADFLAACEELRQLASGEVRMSVLVEREVEADVAAGSIVVAELLSLGDVADRPEGAAQIVNLLAQADAGSPARDAFERIRERIYRRHTRARERLLAAIDALHEADELPEDEAAYARGYVERYLNRQTGS